ncbi:helix-turn-helix domain-containing protein [Xanthobacter sp. KR7-65]|uniref:TetR/AcrR family transcriptional regulator n=1 Tax=Xanthobacter sp. KR7-65 TaxID=3156612 RepID=UPI0032B3DD28
MTRNGNGGRPGEGVRERKRRETLARISDAAIRLFIAKGYEATTLDEIAAAAGISRRTFFYYFKSKDEILLSLQSGMGDTIADALRAGTPDLRPIDAVHEAVITACAPYAAADMIALDRLMRSSEAVQARKQASYIQHERTLFAALRERWPQPERETALRLVAMMSIGAIRLSLETLSREEGRRSLADLLNEAFTALKAEI